MKRLLLAAALLVGLSAPALAQPGATPAFAPSHVAAVEELLGLMDMEKNMMIGLEMALQEQADDPAMAGLEPVIRQFMEKYLRWEDLKPQFVELYAGTYTEGEIRGLIEFYRTPLGQKVIASEPTLMAKATQIGQQQVQAHMDELIQMLMEHMSAAETIPPTRP
jgi:hypothetical protein